MAKSSRPDDLRALAGQPVDVAAFGEVAWWSGKEPLEIERHPTQGEGSWQPARESEGEPWQLGVEWPEPRRVERVVVTFAGPAPPPDAMCIEYWQHHWPTPLPTRHSGARRGWIGRDDPWHGRWVRANGEVTVEGEAATFTFDPLDFTEQDRRPDLDGAEDYNVRFRKALKVRLVAESETAPTIERIEMYSGSIWREGAFDVYFGCGPCGEARSAGHAEVDNGHLLAVEPLGFDGSDSISDGEWRCRADGEPKGLRLRVLYAECDRDSTDRTVVTCRAEPASFSFLVDDALEDDAIHIRDLGVFVTGADIGMTFDRWVQRTPPRKSIYDAVTDEPEQTWERAAREIPPLDRTKQSPHGLYLPLGADGNRQSMAVRFNGHLWTSKGSLKLRGRDTARLLWAGQEVHYKFGTGDPPDFREREGITRQSLRDGCLPVVTTTWLDREIEYEQTAFAALRDESLEGGLAKTGAEPIVILVRFVIRNATHGTKRARLWMLPTPEERLECRDGDVVAVGRVVPGVPVAREWEVHGYDAPRLRACIDTGDRGTLTATGCPGASEQTHAIPTAVEYAVELAGHDSHAVTLRIPFETPTDEAGIAHLRAVDYDAKLADVADYWTRYLNEGTRLDLPHPVLNDLQRSVRTHVALSARKDTPSGLFTIPAATYGYGPCGNEACMQIRCVDYWGHHDRAAAYLELYLRLQGARPLDGHYRTQEGILQGLGIHEGEIFGGFNYTTDHGFIMFALAEHYRLTRDRAWLERAAPHLVKACDFVIDERQATKRRDSGGREVPEYGLLPAGHLEDNPEWRYWFAVNAHAHGGIKAIAEALAEIGHPDAERLAKETAAYRGDIRRALERAVVESPVVRLLDGSYSPHVPVRTGLRARELGWFREAAYGALHCVDGEVLDPGDPIVTWILRDLEDNLFVSREWGRPVDLDRFWFSHGGVTIQANLLHNALAYLRRDQIEHAIRAFWNNLGASLYPEVRAFTEHPVIELGHGVGPFYKCPDETGFLTWLRMFLVCEEGRRLWLAPATPREWLRDGRAVSVQGAASHFGPLSYRIESRASAGRIDVTLSPPRRNPPDEIRLRLRHPERSPMKAATVNGQPHRDFDAEREFVRLTDFADEIEIAADY